MAYEIEFDEWADGEYGSWELSYEVFEEVERRLNAELAKDPQQYQRRVANPDIVLEYHCRFVENTNPPTTHVFLFRFRYSQNEMKIIVWDCKHFTLKA